jgi:hypothetical protein
MKQNAVGSRFAPPPVTSVSGLTVPDFRSAVGNDPEHTWRAPGFSSSGSPALALDNDQGWNLDADLCNEVLTCALRVVWFRHSPLWLSLWRARHAGTPLRCWWRFGPSSRRSNIVRAIPWSGSTSRTRATTSTGMGRMARALPADMPAKAKPTPPGCTRSSDKSGVFRRRHKAPDLGREQPREFDCRRVLALGPDDLKPGRQSLCGQADRRSRRRKI